MRTIVALAFVCALVVSTGHVSAQEAAEAEKPITIDFVRKDIHVVAHYLSIKSGWKITVDEDVKEEVTFSARGATWPDMIDTICVSHNLTFVSDETSLEIRIHRSAGRFTRWEEVRIDAATGRIAVCISFVNVAHAILTIARLTQTVCAITTARDKEQQWKPGVFVYHRARASLYADDIAIEDVFRALARQGDLILRWGDIDSHNQGWLFDPMPEK